MRPYTVPDDLAQLDGPTTGPVELPRTLAWGPKRRLCLDDAYDRKRLYETVIREASTTDELALHLDGTLVERLWPQLVLPRPCRDAWERRFPQLLQPGRMSWSSTAA